LGLAAVYMGFLSVGFIFHFLPPILPVVIRDLGISHGQAGLLMSLFALPGILLSLPGGWLVDRYGERLVGSLGLIVMGTGTVLLGLAPRFSLILLARALSGVGAMVGVVALQRLVIRLFAGRGLGLPVGISGSAIPVGIIIILNTAGPVAEAAGWRLVALRAGSVTMAIGLVFAAITWLITRGRALGRRPGQDERTLAARGGSFTPIWIAGAVWFCANGAMTAFMTFAPDHFQGLGFSVSARGLFTSIPMWTSAALGMVTGWFTDRHGGRAAFMTVGMALMGAALVILPTAMLPPSVIGLVLGLSLAAVVTPTIALPGALLPSSHIGRGYGILATCANLGIFIVPPLAGWSRDVSGGYVWPFMIMGVVAFFGVVAANILRRGRFMPGLSRQALMLVILLLLVGCGSQDRYELVAPPAPVADEVDTGRIIDLMVLLPGSVNGLQVADAWTPDDIVVGGGSGRLLRVQGDLCTALRLPIADHLVGALCRPDGSLLVATHANGLWRWAAGVWQKQAPLPTPTLNLLTEDHLGRPFVQSDDGQDTLYRLESGVWQPVVTTVRGRVVTVWAHPDQGTWLATITHNILHLTEHGAVWTDSLAFTHEFGPLELVGDGTGNMACTNRQGELWLRTGGTWSRHDSAEMGGVSGLFWLGGHLFGSRNWDKLVAWENGVWRLVQDDAFSHGPFAVIPADGGALLIRRDGSGYLFDGRDVTSISPSVNGLRGLAELDGVLMVQAFSGDVFRIEDSATGVWRRMGRTKGRPASLVRNTLAIDDRGDLVAVTGIGLEEWNGTDFSLLFRNNEINRLQAMPDGEILFATVVGDVGSLRGGIVNVSRFTGYGGHGIKGLWRSAPGVLAVLVPGGLYRQVSGEPFELQWSAVGWAPNWLQVLSATRAAIVGGHNVRLVTDNEVTDITPRVTAGDDVIPVTLLAVHELAGGGLLAWVRESWRFMLRNETGWHIIDPVAGETHQLEDAREQIGFMENSRQELFFYGPDFLVRLAPTGGMW